MNRVEIETTLNESRNWILGQITALSEEQLHRPLTASQHDPQNLWSVQDHVAHLALIEGNFASMIRRHLSGASNPVGLLTDDSGERRSRDSIMAMVHEMTDEFQVAHRHDTLSQVIALTASARADTLQLLSELTDDQLTETLPGAPWADGTIGAVLAVNADHARMHWNWACEAGLAP
jgi:hypothetical protein